MKVSRFKVILMCAILLPLTSCAEKEDKAKNGSSQNRPIEATQSSLTKDGNDNDNDDNYSIEVYMKRISQKEYDDLVVKSHNGGADSNSGQLELPDIANFDYPYVEGIEDIELSNKINQIIKDAIFNECFIEPMRAISISTPPYSEYEFPGIILCNDILSIPIILYFDYEKDIYKSISVTIDLKTGKRLYLEDIIKLNEDFAEKILYEEDFFIDIDEGGIMLKENLHNYFNVDKVSHSEASKQLLHTLRNYAPKEESKIDQFYLTKDGMVLTEFANNSPSELYIPIKNLKEFLNIKSWDNSVVLSTNVESLQEETLQKISRSDSGLDSIPYLDFSEFSLNNRIIDILKNPNIYEYIDFSNGMKEIDDGLLITERFKEIIIQGIKIGDDIDVVTKTLGDPSFAFEDFLFYKMQTYYLGFKGQERVEQAIVRNNPKDYNHNILEITLSELNQDDGELSSIRDNNTEIDNFFELGGHINGGGWYLESYNGIAVQTFFEDSNVTIYNNFEGELYQYNGQCYYNVIFENEDYIVNDLSQEIIDYISINEKFETEGTLSPSGKLKCIYEWFYSMCQYFTIRTMDHSKPDFRLSVMAGEYKWMNDNYIFYIHGIYGVPYIVKVDDSYTDKLINVFYKLGITKDEEPDSIEDYKIKSFDNNSIILEDESDEKTYKINYSFDEKGLVDLTLGN